MASPGFSLQCFCFAPDFPCPKRNYLHFNIVICLTDFAMLEAQNASAHWSVEWAARLFPALRSSPQGFSKPHGTSFRSA
jgi:hypothetical protein